MPSVSMTPDTIARSKLLAVHGDTPASPPNARRPAARRQQGRCDLGDRLAIVDREQSPARLVVHPVKDGDRREVIIGIVAPGGVPVHQQQLLLVVYEIAGVDVVVAQHRVASAAWRRLVEHASNRVADERWNPVSSTGGRRSWLWLSSRPS